MGYFLGFFAASLVIPVILLIALKLIPGAKKRHGLRYGLAGGLGVALSWVAAAGSPDHDYGAWNALLSSVLLAGIFYWGYRRAETRDKRRQLPV